MIRYVVAGVFIAFAIVTVGRLLEPPSQAPPAAWGDQPTPRWVWWVWLAGLVSAAMLLLTL